MARAHCHGKVSKNSMIRSIWSTNYLIPIACVFAWGDLPVQPGRRRTNRTASVGSLLKHRPHSSNGQTCTVWAHVAVMAKHAQHRAVSPGRCMMSTSIPGSFKQGTLMVDRTRTWISSYMVNLYNLKLQVLDRMGKT